MTDKSNNPPALTMNLVGEVVEVRVAVKDLGRLFAHTQKEESKIVIMDDFLPTLDESNGDEVITVKILGPYGKTVSLITEDL